MSLPPTNRILAALHPLDWDAMQPNLERVEMPTRMMLETPRQHVSHVYFPLSGITSVVAATKGIEIEVGIIGLEGMTGLPILLGDGIAASKVYVQVAGEGLRITVEHFKVQIERSSSMFRHFLRYAYAFGVQTTHTALANGRANISQRLARWLLMSMDRIGDRHVPLTHEFLALMLGVHRPGVTAALGNLEKDGFVTCARGDIVVIDRAGLMKLADGLYGLPEEVWERLMASPDKPAH
jgi:CRP-like cAMP-binding protein